MHGSRLPLTAAPCLPAGELEEKPPARCGEIVEALVAQQRWGAGWAYDGRKNLYASAPLLPAPGDVGSFAVRIEGGAKLGYEVWEVRAWQGARPGAAGSAGTGGESVQLCSRGRASFPLISALCLQVTLRRVRELEVAPLLAALAHPGALAHAQEQVAAGVGADPVADINLQLADPLMVLHTVVKQAACMIPGVVPGGRGFFSQWKLGQEGGIRTAKALSGGLEVGMA
jgi:hypothetical protein